MKCSEMLSHPHSRKALWYRTWNVHGFTLISPKRGSAARLISFFISLRSAHRRSPMCNRKPNLLISQWPYITNSHLRLSQISKTYPNGVDQYKTNKTHWRTLSSTRSDELLLSLHGVNIEEELALFYLSRGCKMTLIGQKRQRKNWKGYYITATG